VGTVGQAEPIDIRTARYWELRAEEARARASEMHDPLAIKTMLAIAQRYELMARRTAERQKQPKT
jgi:hypothetical protein